MDWQQVSALAVVAAAVVWVALSAWRRRGKSGSGCGCSSCPAATPARDKAREGRGNPARLG